MKKVLFIIVSMLLISNVSAEELIQVKFSKCVDGDTAYFIINNEEEKVRFLGVDTPETKHPTIGSEVGGSEASKYTCDLLSKATKIEIEYDKYAKEKDKYGRTLAWIYVDRKLIQKELIKYGYAEVAYVYKNYKYIDELCKIQSKAIDNNYGIWANGEREEGYCKTKSNKKTTTKKVNKKDTELKSAITYFIEGNYEKGCKVLLDSTSCVPIIFLLLIIIIFLKLRKRKKR